MMNLLTGRPLNRVSALAVLLLLLGFVSHSGASILNPCEDIDCQKGQCVTNSSAFLGFECKCDQGWSKVIPMITFLGCFVPDCDMNFTCNNASAPASGFPTTGSIPAPSDPANVCLLPMLCGNGDCVQKSSGLWQLPTYSCNCHQGNYNILNQTMGPCVPGCSLSGSCPDLGIPIISPGSPAPPPPGSPGSPGSPDSPSPDDNEGFTPSPQPHPEPDPDSSPDSSAGERQRGAAQWFIGAILAFSVMWLGS